MNYWVGSIMQILVGVLGVLQLSGFGGLPMYTNFFKWAAKDPLMTEQSAPVYTKAVTVWP